MTDFLLLLGIPGAAAALTRAEQPAEALSPSTEATDKVNEVQYFVFNALAMVVVVGGLMSTGVLSGVPDTLLGLTGASALTYTLGKRLPPVPQVPEPHSAA